MHKGGRGKARGFSSEGEDYNALPPLLLPALEERDEEMEEYIVICVHCLRLMRGANGSAPPPTLSSPAEGRNKSSCRGGRERSLPFPLTSPSLESKGSPCLLFEEEGKQASTHASNKGQTLSSSLEARKGKALPLPLSRGRQTARFSPPSSRR